MNMQSLSEDSEEVLPQKGKQPLAKRTGLLEDARAKHNATARAKYASDPRYRADCLTRGKQWRLSLDRAGYNAAQRAKLSPALRADKNAKQRARYQASAELKEQRNARERARYACDIEVRKRVASTSRAWQKANRHKTADYKKKYEAKPSRKEQRNSYARRRRKDNPQCLLLNRLRARFHSLLKQCHSKKTGRTFKLVGCSLKDLKQHISAQFTEGMSWERISEIHIDHKVPCSSFNMLDPEQQKACFHFTNLQPLRAADNLRKGARTA